MRINSHLDLWKENNQDLLQKDGLVHICPICSQHLPHETEDAKEYHQQHTKGKRNDSVYTGR